MFFLYKQIINFNWWIQVTNIGREREHFLEIFKIQVYDIILPPFPNIGICAINKVKKLRQCF